MNDETKKELGDFGIDSVRAISDAVLKDRILAGQREREIWKEAYKRVDEEKGILIIRDRILEAAQQGRTQIVVRDLRLPDVHIIQNELESLGFDTEKEIQDVPDYDDDGKELRIRTRVGRLEVSWGIPPANSTPPIG